MSEAKQVEVKTASNGFYIGFNKIVAISSKVLMGIFIVLIAIFPSQANAFFQSAKGFVLFHFATWYMYIVLVFIGSCFGLALWPATGRQRLGKVVDKPEFSRLSWFSMLFGAGIGIGMLTFATGEPIYQFNNNPDIIKGLAESRSPEAVKSAYEWSFMHWGLTAWSCYALVGLALAFFAYTKDQPLTIRSALLPLFGNRLSGLLGHVIDIVAVFATILGISVTIGYGVSQFASGLHNISGASWMMEPDGKPALIATLLCLLVIVFASTLSALSGVGRGIKWLSNLNMGLSFFVILFLIVFGATAFAIKTFFAGIWDYILAFPRMSTEIWKDVGTDKSKALAQWQGDWTIFYWAWWIAFAPFVGLFFARISKGRTIREYILGTLIVPSVMCFVWFAAAGGTAIDMELRGIANGQIIDADISSQLFTTINLMLSPILAKLMSLIIVILLMTYLVTSADSAVLVITLIASGGVRSVNVKQHIVLWGLILGLAIAALLVAGGLDAINAAMIVAALPFSFVMGLMALSLIIGVVKNRA